ncbi:hypothetical protein [Nostoc parmelioides]|uniref:Integrase n=1 Tax=Nostoc parmelioides FACHB-3921 TaxID=2692909 RepID=A0ABR8BQ56_9NOSO|nr:hypothetical protein [Nostoc parmelioides]MBD2254936.1 hypothetical protein [Nostoc parmelioides FACHB-3921]
MKNVAKITTIKDAYERYIQEFPSRMKSVKTAIVRYLLPYSGLNLDFHVFPNQPLTRQQNKKGLDLSSKLKIEEFSDLERVLSWQEKVFVSLNANQNVRSVFKSYLRHFLIWCQEQGLIKPKQSQDWSIPVTYTGSSRRHNRGNKQKYPITNRHLLVSYRVKIEQLSQTVQDQLREFEAFWIDPHYSNQRPIPGCVEEMTYSLCIKFILQILGWLALDKLAYYHQMREHAHAKHEKNPCYESDWLLVDAQPPVWIEELHKKYPPKSLNMLQLEDLVSVIDIRTDPLNMVIAKDEMFQAQSSNLEIQQLLAELQFELKAQNASLSFDLGLRLGKALHQNQNAVEEIRKFNSIIQREEVKELRKLESQEVAKSVRSFLNDYIKWLKYQHNPFNKSDGYRISTNYILKFYHATMNLAKFLYREITDSVMYPNYTDIPVIMELRKMRTEEENCRSKPNPVNSIKRNPSWQELGQLLKVLLSLCSPRLQRHEKWNVNLGRLRPQTAVAKDFQRYLIMMFFRIIAPDRQHVVRQLRVHDTLKLYWINWKTGEYEEAPWDSKCKRYKAYYNTYTKLYYLDPADANDEKGNVPHHPKGKAFEWIVDLDETQTKTDQANSYRIPKIYNPELQAWLYGREDYSETWQNWPSRAHTRQKSRYRVQQFNWCGYVDFETNQLSGFRDIFQPKHDYVFTQSNGEPFSVKSLRGLYENIIWSHLGVRANPHGVRSSATTYFESQGMTDAESKSLAALKNHSPEMQDSPAYNKLRALEKTVRASKMITEDFLKQYDLSPEEYGLHSDMEESGSNSAY